MKKTLLGVLGVIFIIAFATFSIPHANRLIAQSDGITYTKDTAGNFVPSVPDPTATPLITPPSGGVPIPSTGNPFLDFAVSIVVAVILRGLERRKMGHRFFFGERKHKSAPPFQSAKDK